jgi:DNA-binding LytR/AlgR family response regulator
MIRVLIVEDEALAAQKLKMILQKIDKSLVVVDTLDSVSKTVAWLAVKQADLIFLDIHLSDDLSFRIFEQTDVTTPIIFTTAYDEYAIKAFRQNSVDYVLKPLAESDIRESITKFYKFHAVSSTGKAPDLKSLVAHFASYQERIMVSFGGRIKSIMVSDVAFFCAQEKAVFMITKEKSKYPVDYTLDKLENILDPKIFFRVNRKFIINIHSIKDIITYSTRQLKVQVEPTADGDILVPADKITAFKKWLSN